VTDRLHRCLPVFIVAVLTVHCAPAPNDRPLRTSPVDTGAGTVASARDYLQGIWVLESFEVLPRGSDSVAVKGTGRLIYDGYANMTMDVAPEEGAVARLQAAGVPVRNGRVALSGRTVVDMQARTLTFVTEARTSGPAEGPLALSRPRHWAVEGNVLTLTTRDEDGRPISVTRWRKQ
jgi:hypothetical protein